MIGQNLLCPIKGGGRQVEVTEVEHKKEGVEGKKGEKEKDKEKEQQAEQEGR